MRVLIADDQPLDRRVLRMTLEKWGYDVVECEDGATALQGLMADDAPRLAILDWMMPGLSGPDICRELRSRKSDSYTFIVLLTSRDEKEDLIEGMDAGADDYVVKPVNVHELQVRLRAGRRIIDLQAELLSARERLLEQATHDALTGILNRRAILEKTDAELNRAMRSAEWCGIVMVDIDHFKEFNDTYGHQRGDEVLKEAAKRMSMALRHYDAVGRYGGEEFLVLLPSATRESALMVAERVRHAVGGRVFITDDGPMEVTISLGVAVRGPGESLESAALIKLADDALYEAKHSGRNRVCEATIDRGETVGI